MTILNSNPVNTNLLQPTKYLLTFSRLKTVTYFCQSVNIPSVTLGEVERPTPFLDLYSPGTKLIYDPFDVTFLVDEELASWKNMYDWFISIANPEGFKGRNQSSEIQGNKNMSDATLTILSALNNPLVRIQFYNCFPTSIGDINFDTKSSADEILTCNVSFRYQSYKYLTA